MEAYPTSHLDTRPPYEPRLLVVISAAGVVCVPAALTEAEAARCADLQAYVRLDLDALAARLQARKGVAA